MLPHFPPKLGDSAVKKLLHYAPLLSPKPELWALEAHVHKTTYGPVDFFGPQMALAKRLDAISQDPKSFHFQGPSPSHLPS